MDRDESKYYTHVMTQGMLRNDMDIRRRTLDLVMQKADAGDEDAMAFVEMYLMNGVDEEMVDIDRMVQCFVRWAKSGFPSGYRELAIISYEGEYGYQKDYNLAFKYAKKAEDLGDKDAAYPLVEMYLYGRGTEQNYDLARKELTILKNGYAPGETIPNEIYELEKKLGM